jgi:hypothetical protein
MLRFWGLCFLMLFASSATAEEKFDPKCSDDRGINRCAGNNQAKTRSKYDLSDKEKISADGTYLRRALFVDGYGNDVLALSFVRERMKAPYVEIRVPKTETRNDVARVVATISGDDWRRVIGEGRYFDRELISRKGAEEDICLHAWVAIVETVDPARLSGNTLPETFVDPEVRSKTQTACNGGLAIDYAFKLVELAYEMMPECHSIPAEEYRNKAMILNACASFSGDRVAAGEAAALIRKIRLAQHIYPKKVDGTRTALDQLVVLANDEPQLGGGSVTRTIRQEMIDLLAAGNFHFGLIKGLDADHAELEAIQSLAVGGNNADELPQRRVLISASKEAGEFRVSRIDIVP